MRHRLPGVNEIGSAFGEDSEVLISTLCEVAGQRTQWGFDCVVNAIIDCVNSFGYEFQLDESSVGHWKYRSPVPKEREEGAIAAFNVSLDAGWSESCEAVEWQMLPVRGGSLDGLTLEQNGRPRGREIDVQAKLEGLLTAGIAPHLGLLVDELNQLGHALRFVHMGELTLGPAADALSTGPHEILHVSEKSPGLWLCCACIATWVVLVGDG